MSTRTDPRERPAAHPPPRRTPVLRTRRRSVGAIPVPGRVLLAGALAAVCATLALLAVPGIAGEAPTSGRRVLATEVRTAITPVVADQVDSGVELAASGGFDAYLIELDTPGGLLTSMRDIVEDVLASEVPVIVYVSPQGARAASAGALITLAAHVAVMAPGTSIGAATPVGMEGEEASAKIVNDAAAQAEALAQLRGRNADVAVDMVRQGRSLAVEEALEREVVDAVAPTLAEALVAADGLQATVPPEREVTLRTAGADVVRHDMGLLRRLLQTLADPNIAFLLLTLGTLGLIYELATPGVGVAGATGATALLLALFSLSVLPVNAVGLLLLAVAVSLFVAELFAPGIGGFAFGGAVVLVLAAMFLFDDTEGVSVDLLAVVPTAVVAALAAILAGRLVVRTRGQPSVASGADLLTGQTLTVRTADPDGTTGRAFAEGAWWTVRSTGPGIAVGDQVRVRAIDGLTLVVDPLRTKEQT